MPNSRDVMQSGVFESKCYARSSVRQSLTIWEGGGIHETIPVFCLDIGTGVLPTQPFAPADSAPPGLLFRAAGAAGWTIGKIVFENQRALLWRLDSVSRVAVLKWQSRRVFICQVAGSGLRAAAPVPARIRKTAPANFLP